MRSLCSLACCLGLLTLVAGCAAVSVTNSEEWGESEAVEGGVLDLAWVGSTASVSPDLAFLFAESLPVKLPRALRWASAYDTVVPVSTPKVESRELVVGMPRWSVPAVHSLEAPNARLLIELRAASYSRGKLTLQFNYVKLRAASREAEVYGQVELVSDWPPGAKAQEDAIEAVAGRLAEEVSRRSFPGRARR